MQLNNTSVPRIKTLIESHSTQFLHTPTNNWNAKRLIGLFQIALRYRELITPVLLVQRLQSDIEECLEKKIIKYGDLAYTIERMKFNVNECIVLNDDGRPIAITVKGALATLRYNQALRIV